jgi:hypothetical protein
MIIEHLKGKNICENFEEAIEVLNFRTKQGVNEFWISTENDYPAMVLLVNNDLAYIHYFYEEGDPGIQSIGNEKLELENDENSVFYTNSDAEEVSVPNGSILSFSKALNVVKEYFETYDVPKALNGKNCKKYKWFVILYEIIIKKVSGISEQSLA